MGCLGYGALISISWRVQVHNIQYIPLPIPCHSWILEPESSNIGYLDPLGLRPSRSYLGARGLTKYLLVTGLIGLLLVATHTGIVKGTTGRVRLVAFLQTLDIK